MNGTRNTSNINTDITQEDIAEFYTYQPNDNSISSQVQNSHMGMKIGVNTVTTKNDISVTGQKSSKRFAIKYDNDDRISGIGISKITTRNRHVSSNNSTKHDGKIVYNSTIDINSHVDTHCFGNNFRIMSSTEKLCSVPALLDELVTTNNGAIVKAATAMFDNNGIVFI